MSGFTFRDTALPAPDFLTMATKLGAAHSLHKPFRPRDLSEAVARCIERRSAMRGPSPVAAKGVRQH